MAEKINLNRASVSDLMRIKGMGQSTAEEIVRRREEIGGYAEVEDVRHVPGVSTVMLDAIREQATV